MNNKDNKLIYEAYLTEKVTELTDKHLDDIRKKFYPNAGDAMWNMAVLPALKDSFEQDLMSNSKENNRLEPNVDPNDEMDPGKFKKLADHLLKLKHGSIDSFKSRTGGWLNRFTQNALDSASRAKKEVGKLSNYKLRSPITKKPGNVYLEEDDIGEPTGAELDALDHLDKKLMEANTFVFPAIKEAIDVRFYFSKFLPTVMSWLQYSKSSVESLVEDVVNALDDPELRDTMQEILFSDNHVREFSGVLNELRPEYAVN